MRAKSDVLIRDRLAQPGRRPRQQRSRHPTCRRQPRARRCRRCSSGDATPSLTSRQKLN
jgi:hypothetical protein